MEVGTAFATDVGEWDDLVASAEVERLSQLLLRLETLVVDENLVALPLDKLALAHLLDVVLEAFERFGVVGEDEVDGVGMRSVREGVAEG